MQPLWTVAEVVAATGGRPEGLSDGPIAGVSIDSREAGHESLFVAIRGDRLDGHDFVVSALAAGASAAVVSEAWFAANSGDRLIVVADPLEALRKLAAAARARSKAQIVAVTGSVGKTTTKEAIRLALGTVGPTHYSIKSFNNHWGVPLMLARLPREARFGVFEIGMNHAGEITPLTRLVRPHVVVITSVAAAHLEFFESVSAIARAKAEIFEGLEPGGTAVVNTDHEYLHVLFERARELGLHRIVTYGYFEEADYRVASTTEAGGGTEVRVASPAGDLTMNLKARGRHMVANALAALTVTRVFDVASVPVLAALGDFSAPEGRGEVSRLGAGVHPLLLVDESYNANVASMIAAMEVFAGVQPPDGRKVLVLGDMLELGEHGPDLHRSLRDAVLGTGADRVFLVGAAMESLAGELDPALLGGVARRVEDLADSILSSLALGDAVMIKGSKGVRLAALVESIKQRFGGVS